MMMLHILQQIIGMLITEDINMKGRFIMTSNRGIMLLVAVQMLMASCEDVTLNLPGEGTSRTYFPRECTYLYASAYKMTDGSLPCVDAVSACRSDSLILRMDVTSIPQEKFVPGSSTFEYTCRGDSQMENAMENYYLGKGHSSHGSGNVTVEYREEQCVALSVTSTVPLFSKPAGADLSDKFHFHHLDGYGDIFIFDSRKNLKGKVTDGMSISEYLSYDPIMIPFVCFRLNDIPKEAPAETGFIISATLGGGKELCDTVYVRLAD